MAEIAPLTEYQIRLVESHVGLAQNIATGFWRRIPGAYDLDELVAIAYQGLITASQKFDPHYRPTPDDPKYDPLLAFAPFARIRITGAVQDWLKANDYVPRRQRRIYKDIQLHASDRTPEEAAEILGVDVSRVRAVVRAVECPPISFDSLNATEDRGSLAPPAKGGTEESYAVSSVQEAVARAVQNLPEFDRSVIVLRYYMGYDFQRIAAELGSSPSAVKEIHQEAVVLLHSVMLSVVTS